MTDAGGRAFNDAEVKHLELVQGVVARMDQNSFTVKTWAVGLIAATFALTAEKDTAPSFVLIALIPAMTFWLLDAFYLQQERLFRRLYDAIRNREDVARSAGPFSMDTAAFCDEPRMYFWSVVYSRTLAGLYVPLVVLVLIAFIALAVRAAIVTRPVG